jgi:hypothetical protein
MSAWSVCIATTKPLSGKLGGRRGPPLIPTGVRSVTKR